MKSASKLMSKSFSASSDGCLEEASAGLKMNGVATTLSGFLVESSPDSESHTDEWVSRCSWSE